MIPDWLKLKMTKSFVKERNTNIRPTVLLLFNKGTSTLNKYDKMLERKNENILK